VRKNLKTWMMFGGISVAASLSGVPSLAAEKDERNAFNAWVGGSNSDSGGFGAVWSHAPGGVQRSGLRWSAVALTGSYQYASDRAPGGEVRGRYTDFSLGAGYEFVGVGYGLGVSIGPSLNQKDLNYLAPGERDGSKLGTKVSAMGYFSVPAGLSAFAFGSQSSSDRTSTLYGNLGFPVSGGLSIGPEVALLDTSDYRQTRVGLHLSGMRVGRTSTGLSVGRTRDMNGNEGGHVGLNVRLTY
jgi:hypothetical protein